MKDIMHEDYQTDLQTIISYKNIDLKLHVTTLSNQVK